MYHKRESLNVLTLQGTKGVKATWLQLGKNSEMHYKVMLPKIKTTLPQNPSQPGQICILTSIIQRLHKKSHGWSQ